MSYMKRHLEEIVPKLSDAELLKIVDGDLEILKLYRECFGKYEGDS